MKARPGLLFQNTHAHLPLLVCLLDNFKKKETLPFDRGFSIVPKSNYSSSKKENGNTSAVLVICLVVAGAEKVDAQNFAWQLRKRKLAKREVRQIFDTLEAQSAGYNVKVTFLEHYNEEITDLLAPDDNSRSAAVEDRQKKVISLMEDGKGCVVVRGLEEERYGTFSFRIICALG
ncbi:putative 125 kDa kinesin-related protein [Morus notabilis]|uniref:Putative 125 kDa kinesin-related protein n=1 Tax=Morus notabilis TaxID=981085 RepID=W9R186_9ROSA|nr:putative 125 kDa kinesin-related protein [Morus notabilis]